MCADAGDREGSIKGHVWYAGSDTVFERHVKVLGFGEASQNRLKYRMCYSVVVWFSFCGPISLD